MTLAECLRRARRLFLEHKHMLELGTVQSLVQAGLLLEAAEGDSDLVAKALDLLDECSPGKSFSMFADGGALAVSGDHFDVVYRYDRKPAEILSVLGKACVMAGLMEAA